MSKIVKTVIVVAIAVAVVVFAPQIAAILASVAGSIGVTVTAAALTSTIIGMGLSLALTATMALFRKIPSMSQSMVDRLNTSVVPTAARKIIFGTTAGGSDVRFFEGEIDLPSTKKDGYVQVIALASHRINALKDWYVETDKVWSNGAFLTKRDGFAPNNPFRVVTEGKPGNGFPVGSGRYWNASASFTGCAYYVPFWKLDEEVWESGIPQRLTAIVEGCPLYDPRRDSTRGGSGAHRFDNQDTWAFRDGSVEIGRNPALALITYLIGWRINGKLAWGMGIPANRIDFDNFRTYANLCEEQVATLSGTPVQRYMADGIFSTTDSHDTVISALTAAMGSCKLTDRGGTYNIVGGYDDTAGPKVAFDANDLVAPANGSSPYAWNPAPASRERFNIVRGRFADPANLYQLSDWGDPIEQPALADGVPRTLSLDLGAVSRAETCQRIAKQFLLREYLCPGMFSATFGPKAFAVEIGSVITLSLPSEGWNNKLFRVMDQAETHDLFFQMTLREEDPAIYAWDREEKPLPVSIRPQGYDPTATITPAGLDLTSASYAGANGVNVSEINVSWTPELSGRVSGIQIQSRPLGSEAWTEQAALFDPKIGTFTFTSNAPGITVEVRARFRMSNAVYSPWVIANVATAPVIIVADWDNVTDNSGTRPEDNATVGAPLGTPFGDGTVDDYIQDTQTVTTAHLTALANGELNRIRDRGLNFPGPAGESIYTLHQREETARKDANGVFAETFDLLGAVTPDGKAFVLGDNAVVVTPTEAGSTTYQSVGARFLGNEGQIEDIKQVFSDEDGTLARALLRVDVEGRMVGYAVTNDGRRGSFVVSADEFSVVDPETGDKLIYADDTGKFVAHDVEVDTLKVGAVDYSSLQLGAAQKASWFTVTTDISVPQNGTSEVARLAIVKEDTDSVLKIQMYCKVRSPDDLQFVGTILVDGRVVDTTTVNIVLDNTSSAGQMPITPIAYVTGIAAGAHTVSFNLRNSENDNIALVAQAGSTLEVVELRKASIGSTTGSGGAIPVVDPVTGEQPVTSGGGHYGGGTGCPVPSMHILMANLDRSGPGVQATAGSIRPGQWVWTQHETTREWGAFEVEAARIIKGALYRTTFGSVVVDTSDSHLYDLGGGWVRADVMGQSLNKSGDVVAITINSAHTYILEGILSHNKVANQQSV